MDSLVHNWTGAIHLASSIIALITGTLILAMRKGTAIHKKVGYLYVTAMTIVVATAFLIYRLFNGFGIFHIAAIVSGLTLAGGMIPVVLKKPDSWAPLHFSFMYWSVMGLYAAFVAEVLVRLPQSPFFGMVGVGTSIVMLLGGSWFYYRKEYWHDQFANT
ncbi:DUF2306 domain-containing protein [Fodinibius sp. N2]|uniref:DUF2306 domain-containing protein n=1 Tax=Fodinibius alkaliphilus TaxID=3140241 RepID=UPI00315AF6FA